MIDISKEELQKCLDYGMQVYEIVEKYNIPAYTIKRRIKKYGLSLPKYIQSVKTRRLRVDAIKRAELSDPSLMDRKINKMITSNKEKRGKTYDQIYGNNRSELIREKMSFSRTGKTQTNETKNRIRAGNIGKTQTENSKEKISKARLEGFVKGTIKLSYRVGVGKGGYKEDIGHYIRSSYEHFFAKLLQLIGVNYEYEPKVFEVEVDGARCVFTPDFLINGVWFEIKNNYNVKDVIFNKKLSSFKSLYPNNKICIIVGDKNWKVCNLDKDIDVVMAEQSDLVEIVTRLEPLAVIKG
jgi:hypothetical protein